VVWDYDLERGVFEVVEAGLLQPFAHLDDRRLGLVLGDVAPFCGETQDLLSRSRRVPL
jgi:hypothetical protein